MPFGEATYALPRIELPVVDNVVNLDAFGVSRDDGEFLICRLKQFMDLCVGYEDVRFIGGV